MAYYTLYQCKAFNRTTQLIEILFQKKMTLPSNQEIPTPIMVPLVEFKTEFFNGNEEKYDPVIISQKAIIKIRADYGSSSDISSEMLFANAYDEWKVIATVDGVIVFLGFITMESEPYILKEKPYDIVVTATDGLGLLKNIPLTDTGGNKYNGRYTLINYLKGALSKTNLTSQIRVYCNIYNSSHQNRFDTGSPDMFTQTLLHHRTFLKNTDEFIDCYSAIELILSKWCVLYQFQGDWVISSVSEMQENFGPTRYFSVHDATLTNMIPVFDNDLSCTIGKSKKIQPINIDQYVSYQYPIKSVKTTYNYDIPDDLINNYKLKNYGTEITSKSGTGYTANELIGWSYYGASDKIGYIKRELDPYFTEIDRYFVVEWKNSFNTGIGSYIKNTNTDFFVDTGDELELSISFKKKAASSAPDLPPGAKLWKVEILRDGYSGASSNHWWTLGYEIDADGISTPKWYNDRDHYVFSIATAVIPYTEYKTHTSKAKIPDNGILTMYLGTGNVGTDMYYKDIGVKYYPYVKGSYLYTKGDYWFTEQTTNIKDIIVEEVGISDSTKRIIKGALWNDDYVLTTPTWYRLNKSESKHFKELVNLGRYRHQYRRQKRINGTFKGVLWSPDGGSSTQYQLCFHKHFNVENEDSTYMLSTPLQIDYVKSQWRGTLIECGVGNTDYDNNGNTHTFNYIF